MYFRYFLHLRMRA